KLIARLPEGLQELRLGFLFADQDARRARGWSATGAARDQLPRLTRKRAQDVAQPPAGTMGVLTAEPADRRELRRDEDHRGRVVPVAAPRVLCPPWTAHCEGAGLDLLAEPSSRREGADKWGLVGCAYRHELGGRRARSTLPKLLSSRQEVLGMAPGELRD